MWLDYFLLTYSCSNALWLEEFVISNSAKLIKYSAAQWCSFRVFLNNLRETWTNWLRTLVLVFLMKDPTVLHLIWMTITGYFQKLDRIHFLAGHSSINPDNITITQTYDLRYQIITTIRTEKGEMGFSIKLRLSPPPYWSLFQLLVSGLDLWCLVCAGNRQGWTMTKEFFLKA